MVGGLIVPSPFFGRMTRLARLQRVTNLKPPGYTRMWPRFWLVALYRRKTDGNLPSRDVICPLIGWLQSISRSVPSSASKRWQLGRFRGIEVYFNPFNPMWFMKQALKQNHQDMAFVWVFPNYVYHHGSCAYFKDNREIVINTFITLNISLSRQTNCCCHVNNVVAELAVTSNKLLLSC